MARWYYRIASSILLLNTDSAVKPLSLASLGILVLEKFDGFNQSINQWINQLNFYSTNIVARQAKSVFTAKSIKQFHNINGSSDVLMILGERLGQTGVSSDVLEGSNWNGWIDRQGQVAPKRRGTKVKCSSTWIGLDSGDWQTNSLIWSQRTGATQQAWSKDRQAVFHE